MHELSLTTVIGPKHMLAPTSQFKFFASDKLVLNSPLLVLCVFSFLKQIACVGWRKDGRRKKGRVDEWMMGNEDGARCWPGVHTAAPSWGSSSSSNRETHASRCTKEFYW